MPPKYIKTIREEIFVELMNDDVSKNITSKHLVKEVYAEILKRNQQLKKINE